MFVSVKYDSLFVLIVPPDKTRYLYRSVDHGDKTGKSLDLLDSKIRGGKAGQLYL